jgi:uncharacterized membrane protein
VFPADLPPGADETQRFGNRNHAHPYGPGWIALECAVLWPVRNAGLFAQVEALKMWQALMLVAGAALARAVTTRLAPARADLAFVAVAANPLLVVEAAGSGHNDLTMMTLLLAGVYGTVAGRPRAGAVAVGLAVSVKLLPVLVLPWLVLAEWRRAGAVRAGLVALGIALPPVVLYLPFAPGSKAIESVTEAAGRNRDDADAQRTAEIKAAWIDRGLPPVAAAVAAKVWEHRLLVLLYGACCAFVWRSRWPTAWVEAWVVLAFGLIALLLGRWYPWYLAWVLVPALTGACRFAVPAGMAGSVLGAMLMWRYTLVW